jgi:mRNA interferase MazF
VICKRFDVVVVPFPFTDRRTVKRRPALVLSSDSFSADTNHTVLAMITSAENAPWPLDVVIDAASAGLHAASRVRMKVFTLDNRLISRTAGSLSSKDRKAVVSALRRVLP